MTVYNLLTEPAWQFLRSNTINLKRFIEITLATLIVFFPPFAKWTHVVG